jgi:hypothetical protein
MVKFFLQNFGTVQAQTSTTTEPRITSTAKLEEKWARLTWEANSATVLPWVNRNWSTVWVCMGIAAMDHQQDAG